MDNKMYMLTVMLDCGYLDIDYLDGLLDSLSDATDGEMEFYDIVEELKNEDMEININTVIFETLMTIENAFIEQYNDENEDATEISEDDFEIFANAMDSHLTYMGDNDKVLKFIKSNDKFDCVEY